MTARQRLVLAALAAGVAIAGATAVLLDDGDPAEVTADAAETTSVPTTAPSTTADSDASTTTVTTVAPPTTTTTTAAARPAGQAGGAATTRPSSPAPVPPPATTAPAPPFRSSVQPVTAAQLGSSWREGCPVGPAQLRALEVSHWGYDGSVHTGRVIVHADQADRVVAVFRDVYAARFPIERMVPVDAYGSDDQASMRANNTSGFNCRTVSGSTSWSEHAYGRAIDVNPLVNPYVKGSTVDPPEGAPYADRTRNDPGMIHDDDAVVRAFAAQGWRWGGYWSSGKDYQHFSASGR